MESVKFLFVSDLHMSNRLPYAKPIGDGITDRLFDQLNIWEQIYKTIENEDISAVFILGDLFDRSLVDAVTLTQTTKAISDCNATVYILPGNHDANNIKGGRFTVEAFNYLNQEVYAIGTDEKFVIYKVGSSSIKFWPVAFRPLKETANEIERIRNTQEFERNNKKGFNVLLLHTNIVGSKNNGWVCDDGLDPDFVVKDFDFVLSGHFHEQQTFGGGRGFYIGAPMQHHFGDAGSERGFAVVEFTEDKWGIEHRPTIAPKFFVETDLNVHDSEVQAGDYLRYEIEATSAEWKVIRPTAEDVCKKLKDKKGLNADYKHKLIQQHESRLKSVSVEESVALTMEESVEAYVEAAGVVTTGLDEKHLKKIGLDVLQKVRNVYGTGRY